MAKSLQEYADWLFEERDLLWPVAPQPVAPKATPFLKVLPGIRAVTWNIYGTLLSISDGQLLLQHPQQIRMQVALEKTIHEFNMWHSMTRKPGAPWEYMLQQYNRLIEDRKLAASGFKGEAAEINTATVWRTLIERLGKKEYSYDEDFYGDLDEYGELVAFFFHSCLQGVGPTPKALQALETVKKAHLIQGLIGDAQPFTLVQLTRALRQQGEMPTLSNLFTSVCVSLSHKMEVRQPSPTLFRGCLQQFERMGIAPSEVLHVSSRLRDDLAVARQLGMRTALYAGDKASLQATPADMQEPALRPDRILTNLGQIRQILGMKQDE